MCIVYTVKTAIIQISNPLKVLNVFSTREKTQKTRKVEILPIISQYIYYVLLILHIDIMILYYHCTEF
jgi:hypothetical protein